MEHRIIDLHRKSGDTNIGTTLLRLASLAMARHAYEKAITDAENQLSADEADDRIRKELQRANGIGPGPVAPRGSIARTDHTEVVR